MDRNQRVFGNLLELKIELYRQFQKKLPEVCQVREVYNLSAGDELQIQLVMGNHNFC